MADKPLYKIIFHKQGKVYELYSEGVTSSGLWGFIEVSDLVFETGDGLAGFDNCLSIPSATR